MLYKGKQYEKHNQERELGCFSCAFGDYDGCRFPSGSGSNPCYAENYIWKEVKIVPKEQVTQSTNLPQDSIIEDLRTLLKARSDTGIKKYGVTLDRKDLKPSEWCQHLLEELLDASGYVLRLKKDLEQIEQLGKG